MGKDTSGYKLIANNKKARHDYFLEETFEAGVALHGTEVKSLRRGNCSIKEAFIHIENGEVIIYDAQKRDPASAWKDQGKRLHVSSGAGVLQGKSGKS